MYTRPAPAYDSSFKYLFLRPAIRNTSDAISSIATIAKANGHNAAITMPKPAQPFKQAIADDSSESTTKKRKRKMKRKKSTVSNSNHVSTSPISAILRLRTMSTCREMPSCLSTARSQHAPNLAPIPPSQNASFLVPQLLVSLLGYVRYAEDMEATGQG